MVLTRIPLWERLQPRIIVGTTIAAEVAPTVFKALKPAGGLAGREVFLQLLQQGFGDAVRVDVGV